MKPQKIVLGILAATLILNGCSRNVIIPDTKYCAAAGSLLAGADCFHTISDEYEHLNLDEYIAFIQATGDKPAAISQSYEDFGKIKTTLEVMCAILGDRCTYEQKQMLQRLDKNFKQMGKIKSEDPLRIQLN